MAFVRRIDLRQVRGQNARELLRQEWLVTNGLGGYASATISGVVTWRYHGLLIAALPAGRVVVFNHLAEHLWLPDGRLVQIGGEETSQSEDVLAYGHFITEFRLENQMPVWRYEVDEVVLEKSLVVLHGQNTVHVTYRVLSRHAPLRLELCPSIHFRGHEHSVSEAIRRDYVFSAQNGRYEVSAGDSFPPLRMVVQGDSTTFTHDGGRKWEIFYQKDADRGYDARGTLWSPGFFSVVVHNDSAATLIASTEQWGTMLALSA